MPDACCLVVFYLLDCCLYIFSLGQLLHRPIAEYLFFMKTLNSFDSFHSIFSIPAFAYLLVLIDYDHLHHLSFTQPITSLLFFTICKTTLNTISFHPPRRASLQISSFLPLEPLTRFSLQYVLLH